MLNISTKTKLSPEQAIQRAVDFFGPGGYGLEIKEQCDDSVYLVGGGGSVSVSVCTDEGKTSVDVTSQEWDYQAKEFIQKMK